MLNASLAVATLLLSLATTVHSRVYQTRFENVTWDDDNWRIHTTYADQGHYQARATLSNGYLGIGLSALGPFFEVDEPVNGDNIGGWPLFSRRQTFASVAGFWDEQPTTNGTNFEWLNQYGGESTITGLPHWSGLYLECNGHFLRASTPASQIKNFHSTWNFRKGLMNWNLEWTAPGCPAVHVSYQTFVHKLHIHKAATRLRLTAEKPVDITVHDVFEGDCAVRSGFVAKGSEAKSSTIWSAVHPVGLPHVQAYVYSTAVGDSFMASRDWTLSTKHVFGGSANASSISQSNVAKLKAGKTATVQKFIGAASSDAIDDPKSTARKESLSGAKSGYRKLRQSHKAEWAAILTPDNVDSFHYKNGSLPDDEHLIEMQINAVTNPYQILQNTVGSNALKAAANNEALVRSAIPVGGWGSDAYAGMIFWDDEIWMLPGMVLTFPEAMKTIPNYRLARYKQAKKNVKTSYTGSMNMTDFSAGAAVYPWTSARPGNCTGTGPCWDYEYHINGDIAMALEAWYLTTGDTDTFRDEYFPLYESIATLYSDVLALNKTTHTWMLFNATDPDEFANHVDNPAYTMFLIQHVLRNANAYREMFNSASNNHWNSQASDIEIPSNKEAGIHLEFTGMNGSIEVKQADVILLYDLLGVSSSYRTNDLDFYAGRQSLDGPGMTYAVFSILANADSPAGCSSYSYALWSSEPYARAPWFQYSEQLLDDFEINGGFHPAFPFLTGIGGHNRVTIFGFLGYHLLDQGSLRIDPSLPPQIPQIKYRTFYWRGHAISATSNQTHTVISRINKSLPSASRIYAAGRNPIPVTVGNSTRKHLLSFNSPLVISNRRPALVQTVPGNIAQCVQVTSPTSFLPGQYPLSAIDGAVSTKWQPTKASTDSSITVHLGKAGLVPISGFAFDWAQAPPVSWSVSFSNHSNPGSGGGVQIAKQRHVKVEKPYNPKTVGQVAPYDSNTTSYALDHAVWGGKFATLTIRGNQGQPKSGQGATVAEWAIIAESSHGGYKNVVQMRRFHSDDGIDARDVKEEADLLGIYGRHASSPAAATDL